MEIQHDRKETLMMLFKYVFFPHGGVYHPRYGPGGRTDEEVYEDATSAGWSQARSGIHGRQTSAFRIPTVNAGGDSNAAVILVVVDGKWLARTKQIKANSNDQNKVIKVDEVYHCSYGATMKMATSTLGS
ncbi:hypothetical protein J6590_022433 [Homalodisca vitripennis]|nr:hypothetical protein J6590_022433 [Homalodisca vitripennis]